MTDESGSFARNDRVSLILVDRGRQRGVKILDRARVARLGERLWVGSRRRRPNS